MVKVLAIGDWHGGLGGGCKIYRIVSKIVRNHRTSLAARYTDSRLREIQRSKDASWHSSHWVSPVADVGQWLAVVLHGFLSCQDEWCERGQRFGHLQERMLQNNSLG